MKISKLLFVFASCMILFTFAACSSDDDKGDTDSPSISGNKMIYDGQNIPIKSMIVERGDNEWSDDGSREYYISFLSSEVTFTENDYFPTQFPVTFFDFFLFSNGEDRPNEGDYTFNEDYDIEYMCQDGLFISNLTLDLNDEDDEGEWDIFSYVSEGNVEVIQTGNTFEVEFEVSLLNGKTLQGYYKGNAIEFDEEDYDDWRPATSTKKFRQTVRDLQ